MSPLSTTPIGMITVTRAFGQRIPGKGTVKITDQQQFCYSFKEGPVDELCGCGEGITKPVMYYDVILDVVFLNKHKNYPALRDATEPIVIRIRSVDDLLIEGAPILKPGFQGQDHREAREMRGDTQMVKEFGMTRNDTEIYEHWHGVEGRDENGKPTPPTGPLVM